MGSDLFYWLSEIHNQNFNPRSPDGERQAPPTRPTRKHQHFNPRSPDGERQCLVYGEFANHEISIHAPRMGSDSGSSKADSGSRHFNPRSPDGERLVFGASARTAVIFQSTLPGWGATSKFCMSVWFCEISIHAPRMGSDRCGRLRTLREPRISIHAPRMGSDHLTGVSGRTTADFNPRSPDGERRVFQRAGRVGHGISIHAPRMGSDRENGHLRPRYGQNHPFSTLIVSQIVVDVLGTVRKSQKHQRTSHYEVIKQPERQK